MVAVGDRCGGLRRVGFVGAVEELGWGGRKWVNATAECGGRGGREEEGEGEGEGSAVE